MLLQSLIYRTAISFGIQAFSQLSAYTTTTKNVLLFVLGDVCFFKVYSGLWVDLMACDKGNTRKNHQCCSTFQCLPTVHYNYWTNQLPYYPKVRSQAKDGHGTLSQRSKF